MDRFVDINMGHWVLFDRKGTTGSVFVDSSFDLKIVAVGFKTGSVTGGWVSNHFKVSNSFPKTFNSKWFVKQR